MTLFTAALPDKRLQVLALLEWYGSGAGPWSGYPSYEDVATKMLFDYSTANIISIINSTQLSTAQTEGAARFFGGWDFSQKRPDDLDKVPDKLKEQLWEHVSPTMDKDKLASHNHILTTGALNFDFGEPKVAKNQRYNCTTFSKCVSNAIERTTLTCGRTNNERIK
ncbi:hypothetical protein CWB99_10420 [Pseudoalteromonas rubra]|uniref:Uncharacterized protein n=2 Tax=Pseudoalteromonas rubra TaxID=43658 RepID=A0A5S3WLV3_9GAMM|nr:hypothetical protein CWC00_21100 [Pseudoalteromonas rubra]TMP28848.1 hypothetical protein CWB99_10420 [Pseudoalteromonas rubra]